MEKKGLPQQRRQQGKKSSRSRESEDFKLDVCYCPPSRLLFSSTAGCLSSAVRLRHGAYPRTFQALRVKRPATQSGTDVSEKHVREGWKVASESVFRVPVALASGRGAILSVEKSNDSRTGSCQGIFGGRVLVGGADFLRVRLGSQRHCQRGIKPRQKIVRWQSDDLPSVVVAS